MLITEMKATETILSEITGKAFVINCHGCREIRFPEAEAEAFQRDLIAGGVVTGVITTDYICNPENLDIRLAKYADEVAAADVLLVFSCGVGVQTVAEKFPGKKVVAACDTYALPGYQGVTPLEHDCKQCGECFLNLTGGICPLTACSKSLVNGQCCGAKAGKCEVDPNMECGWERIYQKLKKVGRLDALKCPVQVRNYATDDEVSKSK